MGESKGERKSEVVERGCRRRNATMAMTLAKAIFESQKRMGGRGLH